jgi:hypothetical protein
MDRSIRSAPSAFRTASTAQTDARLVQDEKRHTCEAGDLHQPETKKQYEQSTRADSKEFTTLALAVAFAPRQAVFFAWDRAPIHPSASSRVIPEGRYALRNNLPPVPSRHSEIIGSVIFRPVVRLLSTIVSESRLEIWPAIIALAAALDYGEPKA